LLVTEHFQIKANNFLFLFVFKFDCLSISNSSGSAKVNIRNHAGTRINIGQWRILFLQIWMRCGVVREAQSSSKSAGGNKLKAGRASSSVQMCANEHHPEKVHPKWAQKLREAGVTQDYVFKKSFEASEEDMEKLHESSLKVQGV
jgi:hypothetical protein